MTALLHPSLGHRARSGLPTLAVGLMALALVAGCGSSSSPSPSAPAASGGGGGGGTTITATETEFKITLSAGSAAAGSLTFVADNKGTIQHELILVKTDDAAGSLPMSSDGGTADLTGSGVTQVGEATAVDPGTTKSFTVTLQPGKYVLLCNLPAHYQSGMHAAFTVSGS